MTRLEAGALALHREWHPLEEIVGAALGRLARRLGTRPVLTDLPGDLPLVQVDDVLLEHVLLNLVDNAIKYTPPDSPIEISADATGDAVVLSVADHGPGLPPGEEERVFDRFYRADPAWRGQPGDRRGVGLGLTICRGIVAAHGGRIWAEHRVPRGVVFRVSLPATTAAPAVALDDR
jgi:two-component system sensor histidine kinase KdpD